MTRELRELEKLTKKGDLKYFMVVYCSDVRAKGSPDGYERTGYQAKAIRADDHQVIANIGGLVMTGVENTNFTVWYPTLEGAIIGLLKEIEYDNQRQSTSK